MNVSPLRRVFVFIFLSFLFLFLATCIHESFDIFLMSRLGVIDIFATSIFSFCISRKNTGYASELPC